MLQILRLIVTALMFLLSLLNIIKAPTYLFWKLSIVTMEWGHVAALICLFLLFGNTKPGLVNKASLVLSGLSILFYLTPYYKALKVASSLDGKLNDAFGYVPGDFKKQKPLTMKELWFGTKYTKHSYKVLPFQTGNDALKMDFYPHSEKNKPCVMVIHGGGWDSGDSQQLAELNSFLVDAGFNVASVNYRLAPKYVYTDIICDVRDAFFYLKKHASELGIDSTNFMLLGRSAGGQLALQAAYTFKDPNIKGVVAFYTPADMVWGYSVPGNPLIMDSRKVLSNYIGGSCDKNLDKYKMSSPVENLRPGAPPTLLLHGEPDVMVAFEHSRRLNAKLEQEGVKHLLVDLPWATHGFDFNLSGPGGQISTYTVERFLNYCIKTK